MAEVRSAIHVRTGQRAASAALDDWLARHAVDVTAFPDAYDACVYLLTRYERIPDVALVGADWLADEEFGLVAYIRQTWPRTALIVYGSAPAPARVDLLPMTETCYGDAALRKLLAGTPEDLATRLTPEGTPPIGRPPLQGPSPARTRVVQGLPPARGCQGGIPAAGASDAVTRRDPGPWRSEFPRSILTAEELSALLDRPEAG